MPKTVGVTLLVTSGISLAAGISEYTRSALGVNSGLPCQPVAP